MITENRFDTGTVVLNYAEIAHPEKPMLMLLHGGSARWSALEAAMVDLSRDYHVIAPDLRGHGRSDHVPNAYRLIDFADDIEALIRHFDRQMGLFGHSLGGHVGLMVAACIPDRIRILLIGDAPLSQDAMRELFVRDRSRLEYWIDLAGKPEDEIMHKLLDMEIEGRTARDVFGADSPWFPYMAQNLTNHDPTMLSVRLNDFDNTHEGFDMPTLLPQITCPTLLLQADPTSGGLMSDAEVVDAMTLLPNPHHTRLDGIGHALFPEDYDRTMQAIRTFLRSEDRQT